MGSLTGNTEFRFSTGGPAVIGTAPYADSTIEEDQHFMLDLTGPAVESTVMANAFCQVDGIGERIPVRLITGTARNELLKARSKEKQADRVMVLTCQRPLPNGAAMRLVWGKGIAAQFNQSVVTTAEQSFKFRVRPAFTAEFSCERERAEAPCLPLRPLTLRFSSPVHRTTAEATRLQPPSGKAIAPKFDKDDKATEVEEIRFAAPFPEQTSFTVELPRDLKDLSGRSLSNVGSFPLKVVTGIAPPIAKFAAAPFGVIELSADASAEAMLPVTLRHVQTDLRPAATTGSVRIKTLRTDADIIAWYRRLNT